MNTRHLNDKLTPRQWRLYNLLKENTHRYMTQREICDALPKDYEYKERPNTTDRCSMLWKDVYAINTVNGRLEKTIATNKYRYKLQTKEEADATLRKLKNKGLKYLAYYSTMLRKATLDGQGKLLSNDLQPIDSESTAREFYESFVKELSDNEF